MKIVDIKVTKEEWRSIQEIVEEKIAEGVELPFMVHYEEYAKSLSHNYYIIEVKDNPSKKYLIGATSIENFATFPKSDELQALDNAASILGEGGYGKVRKVLWQDGSVSAVKILRSKPNCAHLIPAVYNYQITENIPVATDNNTIGFYYNQDDSTWEVYKGTQKMPMQSGLGKLPEALEEIVEGEGSLTHLEDNFIFVEALQNNQKKLHEILPENSTFESTEVNALRKLGYLRASVHMAEEEEYLIFQTLFEGDTLRDFFTNGFAKDVSRSETIKMGYLAASAVAKLYEQNIIQLDFNPGNFVVNYFKTIVGVVSAIDFGVARIIGFDQEKLQKEKQSNTKTFIRFLMEECFVKAEVFKNMFEDEQEIYDKLETVDYLNIGDLITDLDRLQKLAYDKETNETKKILKNQQRTIDFLKDVDRKNQPELGKPLSVQDSEFSDYLPLKTKKSIGDDNVIAKPIGYDETVSQELEFNKTTYIKPKGSF